MVYAAGVAVEVLARRATSSHNYRYGIFMACGGIVSGLISGGLPFQPTPTYLVAFLTKG
jgi:hypothetical protein